MSEEVANEKTHVRCKIIIEVLGKPKEHVESSIRQYVDKIREDDDLILLNAEFSEAEEKEEMFAVFVEMEVVVKGIVKLVAFCFDYMPSSVEIVKPKEFAMKANAIEDFINNLQSRLHQVDMIVKKLRNENEFIKKNMNAAVTNVILVSLAAKKMNEEELSRISGIQLKELKVYLIQLEEDKKIQKEGDLYSIKT